MNALSECKRLSATRPLNVVIVYCQSTNMLTSNTFGALHIMRDINYDLLTHPCNLILFNTTLSSLFTVSLAISMLHNLSSTGPCTSSLLIKHSH